MLHALRSTLFYAIKSFVYFAVCYLAWHPLPVAISLASRVASLGMGGLFYFGGLGFVLWGRLTLDHMYFVSTGVGAQLFASHQLITTCPYAIVRHPMYAGLSLAMLGGVLLYRTWTFAMLLILPLGLARRARQKEQALATQFGQEWQAYCQRVPAFSPASTVVIIQYSEVHITDGFRFIETARQFHSQILLSHRFVPTNKFTINLKD